MARRYLLLGPDGRPYRSVAPGTLGGHRRQRIYGRLDCPAALRALERGHYARYRVFFADEPTAVAAGYRPCARCLPAAYRRWKDSASGPHRAEAGPGTGSATALSPPDGRALRADVPVHQLQCGQQDQREPGGQVVTGRGPEDREAAEDRHFQPGAPGQ